MEPYKCLIVDDEKPAHLVIKSHLSKCESLEYSASAYNGKEAIDLMSENNFDLIFLDIEMPLVNGLELMNCVPKRPVTIVTTAFTNFAFEAYQNDAVDYLLKPISFPRFLNAIEKAKRQLESKSTIIEKNNINVNYDGVAREIKIDDILYIQSLGNYIKLYFVNSNKPITVYSSLKNILDASLSFYLIQAHKSFVINKKHIVKVEKECAILIGNKKIPLGRKYEILLNSYK